jgi:SpoIID/LytB domain protein
MPHRAAALTATLRPRPTAFLAVGLVVVAVLALGRSPVESVAQVAQAALDPQPTAELRDPAAHRAVDPGTGPEAFVPPAPLEDEGPPITIRGAGWGHSVGMSQYGAQAQALSGWSHAAILGHWYPGTELSAHPLAERNIATNLFHNRSDVETDRVEVQTAGGEGVAPMRIDLGDGEIRTIPRPQTWTVRHDGDAFTLADADGSLVGTGPGPVRVAFGEGTERPNRLRMPQIARGDALAGQYRWGTLRITVGEEGDLRPVLVLPVELYLRGLAEMPSGWQPEALAAQAIAGRGYAVRMVGDGLRPECDCHLSTTPHDQAYAGWQKEGGQFGDRWRAAVLATTGMVLEHEGELAWTYYSSSHSGRSEASGDSWAYPATLPYLVGSDDPWSNDPRVRNPMSSWERTVPNADVARAFGLARIDAIEIVDRTDGGTPRTVAVRGIDSFGNVVDANLRGWRKGIAGADLKLTLRSTLPSMQIRSITVDSQG